MAGYLAGDVDDWIYIDIADQHPDSMRFIKDCGGNKSIRNSKRMVIHDTAFVAWCYEKIKGVLDKRRNQQFYGWISCRKC